MKIVQFMIAVVALSGGRAEMALAVEEKQIIDAVLKSHPLVRSAALGVDAAKGALRASEGEFDTKVKVNRVQVPEGSYQSRRISTSIEQPTKIWGARFTAGYNHSEGSFPVYYGNQVTGSDGETFVGVQLPLLRDGPVDEARTRIRVREFQQDENQAALGSVQNETVRSARKSYWDWVGSGYRLKILRDLLKLAEDRNAALAKRVVRGDKPRIELKDNERLIYQRRNQLTVAEQIFQVSAQQLSLYYQDENFTPKVLSVEELPKTISAPPEKDYDVKKMVDLGLRSRPELREIEMQMRQVQAENRLARNQYLPDLSVQVEKVNQLGTLPQTASRSQNDLRIGVHFEIPLQMRKASGKDRETVAKEQSLNIKRGFLNQKITAEVSQGALTISLLRDALAAAREELKLAREVERGERMRFERGQSDLVVVNLREQATADAALREVDALIRFHKALAELEADIGQFANP